ncbi:unnamed protein product [Protopolystoma xenopodis]|uniref:Uncharacterized protein n=1 Tax=Protopolystoma xenopodis TaxID=117903 RepID=A0A3S5FF60_9PLAT|nr:unnamed protein product [Protopolystoma xenopodis]
MIQPLFAASSKFTGRQFKTSKAQKPCRDQFYVFVILGRRFRVIRLELPHLPHLPRLRVSGYWACTLRDGEHHFLLKMSQIKAFLAFFGSFMQLVNPE